MPGGDPRHGNPLATDDESEAQRGDSGGILKAGFRLDESITVLGV